MTHNTDTVHALARTDTRIETADTKGNLIRVRLASGDTYWVAATDKNALLYGKQVADLLAGDTRYVLSTDPYRAVETDDFTTFRLWDGDENGPVLHAPPEHGTDVLKAVREHRDADSTAEFDTVVDLLKTEYARPHVVNAFAETALDEAPVRVVSEGWVVHDLFLLAWDCDVFPYSGDDDNPTTWDMDADTSPSLYALSGTSVGGSEETSITVEETDYEVNQRDYAFLSAARWLINYENADEYYPEYWENVRRAIERQTV